MHEVFFGVKRVHLLALDFSRQLLSGEALTPARFDMLRIVYVHDIEGIGVPQGNIVLLLGVSAATVSRMLKSLERLRLVVRTRFEHDARCLLVNFTELGRRVVERAMHDIIYGGRLDHEIDEMVHPHSRRVPAFAKTLDFFRNAFDDWALFRHPWRCGQLAVGLPARFFSPPVTKDRFPGGRWA